MLTWYTRFRLVPYYHFIKLLTSSFLDNTNEDLFTLIPVKTSFEHPVQLIQTLLVLACNVAQQYYPDVQKGFDGFLCRANILQNVSFTFPQKK